MTESERQVYEEAWKQVSYEHPWLCVCGRLCTGLHERNCSKFRKAVERRYKKLLKEQNKEARA